MDDFLERWRVPIIAVLIVLIAGRAGGHVRALAAHGFTGNALRPPCQSVSSIGQSCSEDRRAAPDWAEGICDGRSVAHPGVYPFRDGERVEDALKAAGGTLADADLSRLNLAQRLRDEGYIVVPRQGETPVPGASGVSPSGGASSSSQSGKLNINTATLAQLDALPGIGATYAQRILDYRAQNGPFQTVSDLADKKLVPQGTLDKIKDTIDVR